jgi:hypothetical protein
MKKLAPTLALLAVTCLACGDGSLVLIDDGANPNAADTITIKGNIRDVSPQVAGARIVAFAFTNLERLACDTNADCDQSCSTCDNRCSDGTADGTFAGTCQKQFDFDDYDKQRSVAVEADADPMDFTITKIESGDVTVVFLQDDVSNPDGHIDDGDLFAVLKDPSRIFKDVNNGETIRAKDVDIELASNVGGEAEAESVRSVTTDTTVPE